MARGRGCSVHTHTSLVPIERHHIWPLGYHGPDKAGNIVPLCANGHGDVHYLLERLLKTAGRVPWDERRSYNRKVRDLAMQGYRLVMAYAESRARAWERPLERDETTNSSRP